MSLQARLALFRLEERGITRRVVKAPETWWELVANMSRLKKESETLF